MQLRIMEYIARESTQRLVHQSDFANVFTVIDNPAANDCLNAVKYAPRAALNYCGSKCLVQTIYAPKLRNKFSAWPPTKQ